jgi:iron complex transport system ATP-binding protein
MEKLLLRRGDTIILDDISWRVERGQHWVILGANGSGKTSLLRALLGYLTPTDGKMVLLGRDFGRADWRALRKHIGLVSSSVRQLMADEETALETVVSGKFAMIDLWRCGSPADRRRARHLLQRVEGAALAARPWRVLSQGERQRVLIARALMATPRLLILDEPCAGLDPAAREHFLQFLQRLIRRKSSPTVVLVTHHVEEIMPGFSHVLLLQAGRVLATGEKSVTLTARALSRAFNARIALVKAGNRYALTVSPRPDRMM